MTISPGPSSLITQVTKNGTSLNNNETFCDNNDFSQQNNNLVCFDQFRAFHIFHFIFNSF